MVWLVLLSSGGADAKTVIVFDFDGVLVNDRGDTAGWRTYWVLKRIDQRHTSLQPNPVEPLLVGERSIESPEFLEVSYGEYLRLRPLLGKAEGFMGALDPVDLDRDPLRPHRPRTVIPGFYRVSPDITFKHYRPAGGRESYLLTDYAEAKERAARTRNRLNWRGPGVPLLTALARDAATADGIVFSTTRYHGDWEADGLLEAWHADGVMDHITGQNERGEPVKLRWHFLNAPEALLFNGRDVSTKKAEVDQAEATALLRGPHRKHLDVVVDTDGAERGEMAEMHTLIAADDDPRYIVSRGRKLQELSCEAGYSHHIKFVLFNAGSDEEVALSRFPYRWTVFDRGFARPATRKEIELWAGTKSKTTCDALLAGEPAKKPKGR